MNEPHKTIVVATITIVKRRKLEDIFGCSRVADLPPCRQRQFVGIRTPAVVVVSRNISSENDNFLRMSAPAEVAATSILDQRINVTPIRTI